MGDGGWFLASFSGFCQSFGFSLHPILDFISKKAHAKGELWENSVAWDLAASRSDILMRNFWKSPFLHIFACTSWVFGLNQVPWAVFTHPRTQLNFERRINSFRRHFSNKFWEFLWVIDRNDFLHICFQCKWLVDTVLSNTNTESK